MTGRHGNDDELSDDQLQELADDFDQVQEQIDARVAEQPQDYPAIRNYENRGN